MPLRTIVCLDDLTRTDTWPASELLFDLVRLPIFRATGLNIGRTPHRLHQMNLLPGFSLAVFRQHCEADGNLPPWQQLQHQIPQAAADYLVAHLPAEPLVLGHAMPPWLIGLLDAHDVAYLDLRRSPLRFGHDLYIGLATNRPELHAAVQPMALTADALLDESNLMAARLRMQRRSEGRLRLPNNPCIFVGQPEDDPALVQSDGRIARAVDHAELLRQLAGTGPMMYLPHPKAGDFARIEREAIERVTGQRVAVCEADTYDLLACDDELMLIGLNAGALQEAAWFARPAYALCPLPDRPVFDVAAAGQGWLQLTAATLMSEALWAAVFEQPPRAEAPVPVDRPNLLRELFNDWWGYADATLRSHDYHRQAHALAGGQRLGEALRRSEADLVGARRQIAELAHEVARLSALVERALHPSPEGDLGDDGGDPGLMPAARPRRNGGTRKARAA